MDADIFEFWKGVSPADRVHEGDRDVLRRAKHNLSLECLPGPFKGRLKTAPVVLLLLNPGFRPADLAHATSSEGQDYYARSRTGDADLPSSADNATSETWTGKTLKPFGLDYSQVREKIAILNLCAYHSDSFVKDEHLLSALPSSRVAVTWAQSVLYPSAQVGDRVVVCLRAPGPWGLKAGMPAEGKLFAPRTTRGAGMCKKDPEEAATRREVIEAVRAACAAA